MVLIILSCAVQLRKKVPTGAVDAADRNHNQASYMRDVRARGREMITGRLARYGQSSQYPRGGSGMGNYMTDSPDTSGYATPTYGNGWPAQDRQDRGRYSYNNDYAQDVEKGNRQRTDAPYHDDSGANSPEKGVDVTDHAYDPGQSTPGPAEEPVQVVEEHLMPDSKH